MSEIRVQSGGAPKEAFAKLVPQFEGRSGHKLVIAYAVTSVITSRIEAGEAIDILVLPVPMLDTLQKAGTVRAGSAAAFGIVGLTVVTRRGLPKPDISTPEAFKEALLNARSIVHSPAGVTPSGTHLGKVLAEIGIADAMKAKTVYKPALDGGVELVGKGEVDLGIYPASEVINVAGLDIVGPVPMPLGLNTIYGAAVTTKAAAPDAATAFVTFLTEPANAGVWRAAGFTPP